MKKITFIIFSFSMLFTFNLFAQHSGKVQVKNNKNKASINVEVQHGSHHGKGFVDLDGDGYNDNAPDHDGDGIPNGLDPDYRKGKMRGFVDLDGDGINDNAGFGARKHGKEFRARMKAHREMLHNAMENGFGVGMKNAQHFGKNNFMGFGSGHFNGFGFGFGFSNKFGHGHSGGSGGNGNGSGNGDGTGGTFDGPWNWGWGHGHNGNK